MFPFLSTRENPLGPLLLCDRTSPYPANMQSEKTITDIPKRIMIPPRGRLESTRPKLAIAIATIGVCLPQFRPYRFSISNSFMQMPGQRQIPGFIVYLGFYGKVGAPDCQRGVTQRSARQHVDSMMSAENCEMRQAR